MLYDSLSVKEILSAKFEGSTHVVCAAKQDESHWRYREL